MKKLLTLIALMAIMTTGSYAQASTVWSENFSDVSDWSVIVGNGTITSDGSLGSFYEPDSSDVFTGIFNDSANLAAFNPANKSQYDWVFTTDSLTWSVSYFMHLDQFNSSKEYLGTVWNVVPQTTFVGTGTVDMGALTFDAATAYLSPKVDISSGDAGQTVKFDEMRLDQENPIPEPASLLLLGSGLIGLFGVSRKRK